TRGTARRVFAERGYRVEGAVGKTGTLADNRPFRDYSWFIGYAPKDNPRVAVAVVVVNDPIWHIRATWLGREAMRLALARLEGAVAHVVSAAPRRVPVPTPDPLPRGTYARRIVSRGRHPLHPGRLSPVRRGTGRPARSAGATCLRVEDRRHL